MFPSCDEKREFFFQKKRYASLIGNDRNTCIYLYSNCSKVTSIFVFQGSCKIQFDRKKRVTY